MKGKKEGIFVRWDGREFIPVKFNQDCSDFVDDPEMEFVKVDTMGREPLVGERFFAFGRRKEH